MHYALMQNALTSTNMNVRKHFIKSLIPYICIVKCVQNIYKTDYELTLTIIEFYICNRL